MVAIRQIVIGEVGEFPLNRRCYIAKNFLLSSALKNFLRLQMIFGLNFRFSSSAAARKFFFHIF
jgi:hypothetical protein